MIRTFKMIVAAAATAVTTSALKTEMYKDLDERELLDVRSKIGNEDSNLRFNPRLSNENELTRDEASSDSYNFKKPST